MQEKKLDFATAEEVVKAGTCFTTHTPVPAGNDAFPTTQIEHYLGWYAADMKLDRTGLLALGRQQAKDDTELFGMTVLAIRLSNTSNGRQSVARQRIAEDVERHLPRPAAGRSADHRHHQRRPHAKLAGGRDVATL